MSSLRFIFVHGLSGWGSYDKVYRRMPYWGMRGGDLMAFLRGKGYDCYAASVSPAGSAWDRACELYAQLAGTRTDYGKAHSAEYRHARFGRDYSSCPLVPEWDGGARLVLLGHSFGGATVRLFSELLAHGSETERAAGAGSALFTGGMEKQIHSVVALASPMNGTTAYDMFEDPSFDPGSVKVPLWSRFPARMMSMGTRPRKDGRDERDYAGYDMHIDRALELNECMKVLPGVYYFSVPCSKTRAGADGRWHPVKGMEPLFVMRAGQIGAYTGMTRNGFPVDGKWLENDGLVNTVSAMSPLNAPSVPLDETDILPGRWNVFPVADGDHMWPQGGLLRRHDIKAFYIRLLDMISRL